MVPSTVRGRAIHMLPACTYTTLLRAHMNPGGWAWSGETTSEGDFQVGNLGRLSDST